MSKSQIINQNSSVPKPTISRPTNQNGKAERVLAAIDIGNTKVVFIIAVATPERVDVVGVGHSSCTGIRQGAVVNIESTVEAIHRARLEAELMSGYSVEDVWLGVAGNHIQSFDSTGMVAIHNQNEVTNQDIQRVIEAAKAVSVPADRQVLHVLPREYKVNDQDGIKDPIGMSGVRLEASVHIVTGSQTFLQNLSKCLDKAKLRVRGLVLQQLASGYAILSEDEKNLGVGVVDMGGGTCDVLCYVRGSVAHTGWIPVGGNNFTMDVAMGLRTPQASAEIIKKKFGCALPHLVDANESVDVEGVGGRQPRSVLRRDLCEILEARAEETLQLIKSNIIKSGLMNSLGSGIVFTGGASLLEGLMEMGEFVFDVPIRRGIPDKVGGLTELIRNPAFSTSVGLIVYGWEQEKRSGFASQGASVSVKDMFSDLSRRMKAFFEMNT